MSRGPEVIADLFALDADEFSTLPVAAAIEEKMRDDLTVRNQAPANAFPVADILRGLHEALNVPLLDVLRSAWSSLIELQDYRDPKKHPPGTVANIRVGRHKIESKHRPKLAVLLNDQKVGEIYFDVQLTLDITGATLLVRDGRIWQATNSEFEGECALSYSGFTLARKRIPSIKLPGTLDFKGGIPIPSLPTVA
jgi:hypothetical protein